jgi:hypothetical protein
VFQIIAEIGVAAAIAGKPVGQQARIGGDIRFKKGPQFGPRRRRQHGDSGITGEQPVLALDGVPMLPAPVLRHRSLATAATTRLLSGLAVLRPGLVGSPRPPMKVSSASRKPCSGRDGSSLSPWRRLCAMVQAV